MSSQYSIYKTLSKRISRNGFNKKGLNRRFPNNGAIATYLCDLFLKLDGIVGAFDLVRYGIIKEGQTIEFLDLLVKYKYITWDMEGNVKCGRHRYQTFSFEQLSDLLNKEQGQQVATKRDVIALRQEIAELNTKYMAHDKCIRKLIEFYDPPVTEEKVNNTLKWSKL